MWQEKTISLTSEELCSAAHGNLVALIIVANQFVDQHGLKHDTFWHFVGHKFSAAWADVAEGDIDEVALRIARNMASCGAELLTFSRGTQQARLVFTNWPPEWVIDVWDSSIQEAAVMCEVFRPITQFLGYEYDWQLEGDGITMDIKRPL